MTEDDEAARTSRAEELRKRIDAIKHPHGDGGAENDGVREKPGSGGGVSPRDFINEKMRELDQ